MSNGVSCDDGSYCTVSDSCNGSGSCTGNARDCSDGRSCTEDQCDEGNDRCANPVASGCLIGSACIPEGAADPSNPCLVCNSTASTTSYTPAVNGTSCDDGQFCTVSDVCNGAGICGGSTRNCGDGLSCTADSCNEGTDSCTNALTTGCQVGGACIPEGAADPSNPCLVCNSTAWTTSYTAAVTGTSCDDGQFCTISDECDGAGSCGGSARDCDDSLSCTADSCDEGADSCTNALTTGCLIAGACVAEGATDPSNECRACAAAVATGDYSSLPADTSCDDGQFCTVSDVCDGAGVCGGSARDCGDALDCTTTDCDEAADSCSATLAAGCLIDGACIPEGAPSPTDDCSGCVPATSTTAYSPLAADTTCDDGLFCTIDDACDGLGNRSRPPGSSIISIT